MTIRGFMTSGSISETLGRSLLVTLVGGKGKVLHGRVLDSLNVLLTGVSG